MTTTEKKICRRCRGTGNVGSHVVYAGAPGVCFACSGNGEVYKDKFYRTYGVGKTFYGITEIVSYWGDNPNNGTFKRVETRRPDLIDPYVQCAVVEITEEQARKFFDRYGTEAVRVA